MSDYHSDDEWQRAQRRLEGREDVASIPTDPLCWRELARERIRPSTMTPLQTATTLLQFGTPLPYRSSSRRPKVRGRTRSEEPKRSNNCDDAGLPTPRTPGPRPQPIAGDVFAMHPDLYGSSMPQDRHSEPTTVASPLAYLKPKRRVRGDSSPTSSSTPSTDSRSVIFIDCSAKYA